MGMRQKKIFLEKEIKNGQHRTDIFHFPGAHWASEVDGASGPKVHLNFFACLSFILHMILQYVLTKYLSTYIISHQPPIPKMIIYVKNGFIFKEF